VQDVGGGSARVMRIAQELSTMSTSLPLNQSSSVFVRTDEDKIHFMTALITGWVKGIAILF